MFSYLHSIRPNNRRSAVANAATAPPTGIVRHYHEPSVNARDGHGSPLYPNANSPSIASSSPISVDPPIIPPISFATSHHEPFVPKETNARSPRLALEQVDGQLSDLKEPLKRKPEVALGDSHATGVAMDDIYESNGSHSEQPSHFWFGPSQSLEYQDFGSQNTSRPQSKGNLNAIPQPDRPPPPPPVSYAKSEKPGVAGLNQTRHGRTKLNLLNPMSILARRKSSQPAPQLVLDKSSQIKGDRPAIGLSDDYDPRIRGNVIHDFSAPRSGRTYPSNDVNASTRERGDIIGRNQVQLSPALSPPDEGSPNSMEKPHTPVFKEHFDDDFEGDHGSGMERERYQTSAFMYQVSLKESYLEPEPDQSSLPPFARNLVSKLSKATELGDQKLVTKGSLEVVHEMSMSDDGSLTHPSKTSSPVSPPKVRSRASSNADSSFQPGGLPKRFKSNASRFSFDLTGVGSSAQEKILEERHRQKAKGKSRASDSSSISQLGDDWNGEESGETYSGYNSMDDDGGFEESIPGVNADADEKFMALSKLTIHDLQPSSPLRSISNNLASSNSLDINYADTLNKNPGQPVYDSSYTLVPDLLKLDGLDAPPRYSKQVPLSAQRSGLGIAVSPDDHSHPSQLEDKQVNKTIGPLAGIPPQYHFEDDDLYFDDGMIEDVEINENEAFDESVFDDDTSRVYGLPLRDLKPLHVEHKKSDLPSDQSSLQKRDTGFEISGKSTIEARGLDDPTFLPQSKSKDSFVESKSGLWDSFPHASGLTQDNLAAYHDALAFAANQAAINGEFIRSESVTELRPAEPSREVQGRILADGSRKNEVSGLASKFDFQDPDDFDYDDALSDDPIIAAANAEALENDDDGFYGQEFGFFARATGPGEYVNGGYFGPQGVEGIGRSHSGRVNFQEPSLTPITERSEWSNRNSAISLAMHGYSHSAQHAMSSPGLAQLADMISLEEDDLSLSALMKLRRGAWGGSTTSLPSSGNGSQLNLLPPIGPVSPTAATNPTLTKTSSTHSLDSSNSCYSSESDASPSSPTLTLPAHNMFQHAQLSPYDESPSSQPTALQDTPESVASPIRPRSAHLAGETKGHSRKSSGAETVSYMHEKDDEGGGGGRWVVEKRRVGEGGKVEVLGREVVKGGRI